MKKHYAFTLAEVLITIGIIGVIASLVIPQLKQTIDNRELVSKYLKTHNVLTNAYKETEAVNTIQLYKQTPERFKELLESHLKLTAGDCNQDVCLMDGSSYSYECNETACTGIIIDTNGDKKPNSAGKDQYRMLVTDHGLIAQGESEYCGTIDGGLDCGKYILTYHKLFDGLINNCAAYENGQCSQCQNGYQNNGTSCKDIRESTCDTYSGTTCTKCTSENLLVGGECISMTSLKCEASDDGKTCKTCKSGNYLSSGGTCETLPNNCDEANGNGVCTSCKSNYYDISGTCESKPSFCTNMNGDSKCVFSDGVAANLYKVNGKYVADVYTEYEPVNGNFVDGAKKACEDKGMSLPDAKTLYDILAETKLTSRFYWSSTLYGDYDGNPVPRDDNNCPSDSQTYVGFTNPNNLYIHCRYQTGTMSSESGKDSYYGVLCVQN
ncbi:prepilin-type N-terminal cleavage/methylation domain-containing protein [bacterium]|nr:prepilin-type N-terminal cleavage/methylation domain-containing protein [bacterium]